MPPEESRLEKVQLDKPTDVASCFIKDLHKVEDALDGFFPPESMHV